MLVLTRKEKQSVRLTLPDGRYINVIVKRSGSGRATLGFDAPSDIVILRKEIIELKKKED